jgi:hypothetical protein
MSALAQGQILKHLDKQKVNNISLFMSDEWIN